LTTRVTTHATSHREVYMSEDRKTNERSD